MKKQNSKSQSAVVSRAFFLVLFLFVSVVSNAQQQITHYDYNCGSSSSNDNPTSIIDLLSSGSGYGISGYSNSNCGNGSNDWMFMNLNPFGGVNYTRYYGTNGDDRCNSVARLAQGIRYALAGKFYFTSVISKATILNVDSNGAFLSGRVLNDPFNSTYNQVAAINGPNLSAYAGFTQFKVGRAFPKKALLTSYFSGNMFWGYRINSWVSLTKQSPSNEEAVSVCFQPVGWNYGVLVQTEFYGINQGGSDPMIIKTDLSGNILWSRVYKNQLFGGNFYPTTEGSKIIAMPDGGFVVVGTTHIKADRHILVFRVSSNGALMWSMTYADGNDNYHASSVVFDGVDLVLTGRGYGSSPDAIMMKIPATGGSPYWVKRWNTQSNIEIGTDIITSNASTISTGYAVVGTVNTNSNDVMLWRTNSNGVLNGTSCGDSVLMYVMPNNIALDSFRITTTNVSDRPIAPRVSSPNYVDTRICTGTFATSGEEEEVTNDNPEINETPKEYSLSQNYPNPFNPATTIDYVIPVSANVTIRVFDLSGKMVSEIMNEFATAGKHSIRFDASQLPSGTYFYKITTNNFTDIKKMILIK